MTHPCEGCVNSMSWQYDMYEWMYLRITLFVTIVIAIFRYFVFIWHVPHPTVI
jgi:hypothetical protein